MNYFVPNFGRDADINSTWASLDWAENDLSHKFNPKSKKEVKKDAHPVDYKVADFGLDEDVVITQKNIADQEKLKKHKWKPKQDENGVWIVPEAADNDSYSYSSLVQTDSLVQSDPMCSSAGCTYASVGAKPPFPMNYKVPNFGKDHVILESDKNLAWAEKTLNHKWIPKEKPKSEKKPVLYDATNKPLDSDIISSLDNLKTTEKKLGAWKLKI